MKRCALVLTLLLSACAGLEEPFEIFTKEKNTSQLLFNPEDPVQSWRHHRLPRQTSDTEYRVVFFGGKIAIRAVGKLSASALFRNIEVNTKECPFLEWEWRVEAIQQSANLREKEKDDVSASVSLIFGNPGFLSDPKFIPTIRYVWTNGTTKAEDIIEHPRLSVVQNLVVRAGTAQAGTWVKERRNILEDYRRVFKEDPKDTATMVLVLFTDNDQTKEPVEAYYGKIWSLCGTGN